MKHTIETATERAEKIGYAGDYAKTLAESWVGKTDDEIKSESDDFNQNYLRREKYARAAVMETNPKRRAYLESKS
jgi:hypothetical protein